MTVPTDEFQNEVVDLQATFAALAALPPEDRVRQSMTLAAELLEYAAYEMAQEQAPGYVAEIILMAARLDRRARGIGEAVPMSDARGM